MRLKHVRVGLVENHSIVEQDKFEDLSYDRAEKDKKKNNEREGDDRRAENERPTYG